MSTTIEIVRFKNQMEFGRAYVHCGACAYVTTLILFHKNIEFGLRTSCLPLQLLSEKKKPMVLRLKNDVDREFKYTERTAEQKRRPCETIKIKTIRFKPFEMLLK